MVGISSRRSRSSHNTPMSVAVVAGHAEHVVVGANDGCAATMPVEPSSHHPVEFHGDAAADQLPARPKRHPDPHRCEWLSARSSSIVVARAAQAIRMRPGRRCKGAILRRKLHRAERGRDRPGSGVAETACPWWIPGGLIGRGKQAFPQGRNDFLTVIVRASPPPSARIRRSRSRAACGSRSQMTCPIALIRVVSSRTWSPRSSP